MNGRLKETEQSRKRHGMVSYEKRENQNKKDVLGFCQYHGTVAFFCVCGTEVANPVVVEFPSEKVVSRQEQ